MKRVLIVSKSSENGEALSNYFDKKIYEAVDLACSSEQAKNKTAVYDYDIIVINTPISDESGIMLSEYLAKNTSSCILLIIKKELYDNVTNIVCDFGVLTIERPIRKQELETKLRFMAANYARFNTIKQENEKLKSKVDEMKLINRAKAVLIKYLSISEEQAYRYIAKQSMDMRIPKSEVAKQILNAYEN